MLYATVWQVLLPRSLSGVDSRGCTLVGHPEYYKMQGFQNAPVLVHEGVPPEVFMAMAFSGDIPIGVVHSHEGFWATE